MEITLVKATGPDDREVRDLLRRWAQVPPGGTLRLSWPLSHHSANDRSGA